MLTAVCVHATAARSTLQDFDLARPILELLTCSPAAELALAQRYFLF